MLHTDTLAEAPRQPQADTGPDDGFLPEEFRRFADDPESITARAARRFGVPATSFINWRWQMRHQVGNAEQALARLALSTSEEDGFKLLADAFVSGVTPYYLALMDQDPSQCCPVRLQGLPRREELNVRVGVKDPLDEVPHSPVKEVVQVYPDRVAFCVAQLCPVYCRYCFRKRRDEEDGLHFNRRIVDRGIAYIASNPAIRDVLITGGDPFIASDEAIDNLLSRIRAIPHVEIIRFGTRTPVTLPYRVTARLAKILAKFHPVWLNTHFNCAEEITPEAAQAVANLVDHGIPVGNQSVLLRGVNDTTERHIKLLRELLKIRVRPYYLFHPHLIEGTEHLRVPVDAGLRLMKSLRGNITGLGIPTYIVDTPSGKVPMMPNHVLGTDGEDLLLEDVRGQIWREKSALNP
ncbi:MAG: KamA family radical SAM protein [Proteobacteria bacterium]|nr:KamA family radical SAM protein [Pseudomonadota bacterium]